MTMTTAGSVRRSGDPNRRQRLPPERASVLLVDDQPARLLTYEAVLSTLEIRCVRALSGNEALQLLLDQEFAAILLDVQMPEVNGFELARMIREHPRLERTPIIFVTGVHMSELDRLRGYEVGAIDYISVPLVPEILRSKVAVLVELYLKRLELQALNRELEEMHSRVEFEHRRVLMEKESELAAERLRTAAVSQRDSQRLQLITDQLPILISYVDTDGRYQFCNARYCEWFGGSKETFIGQHASSVLGEDAYRERKHLIDRAMSGEQVAFEGPVRHRTLGLRHCDIAYVPHIDSSGKVNGVYVMAHDITERKRSEERVRESEERFRNMADNSPVMIWITDPDGSCSYLNRRWYEFIGETPRDSGPHDWLAAVHEDDRARIKAEFMRNNAAHAAFRLEYRLRDAQGRYRWVMDAAAPRYTDNDRFAGYIGSVIDISERKFIEDALRESEARFRELADAMPQIVFTARPDGVTDYFNQKWYEMTGLPVGSTDDAVWSSRLHPEDHDRTLRRWYEAVRTGEPYQIEYRFNFPERGGYRWHLGRALPARNAAGEIIRWYGTCTDIHDLRVAQEALRQADRRKDEFLATLAHELRNPLAPIRSAIQFLQLQSPADARLTQAGSIIDRQTQVMVRLVDDLLDLSRITRGRITLQRSPLELRDVLSSALDASRTLIEGNRHEIVVSTPSEPIVIDGDSTRLAQIFSNLFNNAAKYTPPGGRIAVTVTRHAHEAVISVADNGIGIPAAMLEAIFEMFTQVASSIDRAHGGLGIGLTLARQLAEMHGGRIEARSNGIGHGSEFLVTLPIADHAHRLESTPSNVSLHGARRRVLIADDNVDAAQMLSFLMEMSGFEVRTAADGPEALKVFNEYQPEVALLDIGMPGMSGYEVATAIRSLPTGKRVLLVAVSGWGQESDRRASAAAGFDHHLTKPVDFDSLQATIDNAMSRNE